MKTVYIGTDHAGFELKEELKPFLDGLGYEVKDMGAFEFNPDDDYPDFIFPVAEAVSRDIARGANSVGIVLGGSGQGEAMIVNRVEGIRAALVYDEYSAKMSREHNDANIISLGSRALKDLGLTLDDIKNLVKIWLETPFSGEERHIRRIKKMMEIENK